MQREKESEGLCPETFRGAVGLEPVGLEPGAFCRWWVQYDRHPALQQWICKWEAAVHVGTKEWVGKDLGSNEKQ